MKLLQNCAIVFLLYEVCDIAVGVDDFTVEFENQKTCFEERTMISIAVEYTGAGTPDVFQWKFSKMTDQGNTLNILTVLCKASAGEDPAFPVSRMNFTCNNTQKKYTTNISGFSEATDAGTWEVALSVSGVFTNFKSVTVEKCAAPEKGGLDWWIILIIVIAIVLGLLFAGIILGCCFPEENNAANEIPTWYKILWYTVIGIPVALGSLFVWRCCKGKRRDEANTSLSTGSSSETDYQEIPREGSGSFVSRKDVEIQETFRRRSSNNDKQSLTK